MWAAIVIIVVALLLVLMAPKPKVENARAASLGDFQFPRSKEGDPVMWFLGTVRVRSPNSLWYGDFTPLPIKKKQKTGLFSSKKVTVGYKYHVGLDLCFGIGGSKPVELLRLWAGKHTFWQGVANTNQDIIINKGDLFGGPEQRGGLAGKISFYPGSFDEERDPYLVDKADPDVPAYVGQCRLVFKGNMLGGGGSNPENMGYTLASGFYFGTTTSIEPIHAEMRRLSANVSEEFSIMPNGFDVNPMEFLHAGFTEKFGMPGVDTAHIDMVSWQRDAETLYNEGMGMSLLVQQSITGKDLCEEALRIADGILYQDTDTGKMVSCLIRPDYVIADLPIIDESIVRDLVNFSKTTWEQTYNQCRVTFKDRSNQYADKVALAQDFANINFQQRVKNTDISVPGCFEGDEANNLATRQLSLLSVPLFQIEIRCNRAASGYKPGQVFKFNYGPYGISNMVMRVQKIDKGTLVDGIVTIHAVQDRFALAQAVFAPPGGTGWVDPVGEPIPMLPQALFELPYEMSAAEGAVVATLGTQMKTVDLGYNVWSGAETDVLEDRGLVTEFTASALLAVAYPYSTDAVDEDGFAVGSVKQGGDVDSVTEDELYAGSSVALIRSVAGDELVAFKDFDGVQVTTVIRGIFGTVPLDHPIGASVFFLSTGYGLENEENPYTVLPRTVFAKLLPYNSTGLLPLDSATELSLDVANKAQRPAVPGRVRFNGARPQDVGLLSNAFVLAWAHRTRLDTQVRTQDDPSVDSAMVEPGTLYNIRVYRVDTDVLLVEELNGDAFNANIKLTYTGDIRVELEAVRGGVPSYSRHSYVVSYSAAGQTVDEIIFDTTTIIFDGGGA